MGNKQRGTSQKAPWSLDLCSCSTGFTQSCAPMSPQHWGGFIPFLCYNSGCSDFMANALIMLCLPMFHFFPPSFKNIRVSSNLWVGLKLSASFWMNSVFLNHFLCMSLFSNSLWCQIEDPIVLSTTIEHGSWVT